MFIWFQKNKLKFLANSLKVFFGVYSWVGYGKTPRKDLPSIRPSILSPSDLLGVNISEEKTNKAFLNYSKDYKIENDFKIVLSQIKHLGN